MKNLTFTIIFFLTLMISIGAQSVETLVTGPSTFDDGLTIDDEGNIYAADFIGTTVTKIFLNGSSSVIGMGYNNPNGIKYGPDGYIYIPNVTGNRIDRLSKSGETSLYMSISKPNSLTFDKSGNLYVAHAQTNIINKIDTAKNVTPFVTDAHLNGPISLFFDEEENFFYANFTDGKIFKKTPQGVTTQIADLPSWLGFMTLSGDYIYATAYQKHQIYKIAKDGSSQTVFAGSGIIGKQDGGLLEATFKEPNGIVASHTGDTLFISEFGNRSLRMIIGINTPTAINDQDENSQINSFNLRQNYPNPFNPTTHIEFSLPEKQLVTLKIFNQLGEEITTLISKTMNVGIHRYKFDGSKLSSGIYIYQLITPRYIASKKMLLLK